MAKPSNPQIGGWYDGQQWDGTRYGAPGQIIVGSGASSGGSQKQVADEIYKKASGEINQYVDQLINLSKGDYDFAAKWIENNYKLAVGTDDQAKAQFLKDVANDLESKVGTIAFDYKTGSYRTNEDADKIVGRVNRDTSTALARLDEDEQVFKAENARNNERANETQAESLSSRGILDGMTRDNAVGLAGKDIGEQNLQQEQTLGAYERALGRSKGDLLLGQADTIADTELGRVRGLEDLTTAARRGMVGEQNEYGYSLEAAKRARDKAIAEAEVQRRRSLDQLPSAINGTTRGVTGAY